MTEETQQTQRVDGRIAVLTDQLEAAAAQLAGGELTHAEATELIERCARLAGEAGAELEQLAGSGISAQQQGELL